MASHSEHGYGYYTKIWVYLVILFVISVLGPELNMPVVTLITAFGIAVVKALLVAAYFLHLNVEKKYIWLLLISALIFIVGFYVGVAPDVQNQSGSLWKRCNAYNDYHRTRIAKNVEEANAHHDNHFAGMGIPHKIDCVPQKY